MLQLQEMGNRENRLWDLEIYFVAEMYYIAEVVILYVQGRGIFTEDKR